MDETTQQQSTEYPRRTWYVARDAYEKYASSRYLCVSSDGTVSDQSDIIPEAPKDMSFYRKWRLSDARKGDILASRGNIFSFQEFDKDKNIVSSFSFRDGEFFSKMETRTTGGIQPATHKQVALIKNIAMKEGYFIEQNTNALLDRDTYFSSFAVIDEITEKFRLPVYNLIKKAVEEAYYRGIADASSSNKKDVSSNEDVLREQETKTKDVSK